MADKEMMNLCESMVEESFKRPANRQGFGEIIVGNMIEAIEKMERFGLSVISEEKKSRLWHLERRLGEDFKKIDNPEKAKEKIISVFKDYIPMKYADLIVDNRMCLTAIENHIASEEYFQIKK